MTESRHTPGDWRIFVGYNPDDRPGIDALISETQSMTLVRFGVPEHNGCGIRGRTPEEALANAHVMAAGNKLLEACEQAESFLRQLVVGAPESSQAHQVYRGLREAIAEAKGEEE